MAFSLVSSVSAIPGINGGATGNIDTTGATLIAVSISWYAAGGANVTGISDNKSNTWLPLATHGTANAKHRWFYAINPIVGSGHNFTCNTLGSFPTIIAYAFSGTAPVYDSENGANAAGGTSLACGSVTPPSNGA
jgi:hypothetical protein